MRIVESSDPNAVSHDAAIWLLQARAVMTTTVCREAEEAADVWDRRADIALRFLRTWIRDELGFEGEADDGLPTISDDGQVVGSEGSMAVPDDGRVLLNEIIAGVAVCKWVRMRRTADHESEFESDNVKLAAALVKWRIERDSAYSGPAISAEPNEPELG